MHVRDVSGNALVQVDARSVAEKIRSGAYFKEAISWYSLIYHRPIAERCYFIVVIVLAAFTTLISVIAAVDLMPLKPAIPFVMYSRDVFTDLPRIQSTGKEEKDPNISVAKYLAKNYVTLREEYNLKVIERDIHFVENSSTPEIYLSYRQQLDPQNPSSPIVRYERHSTRSIAIKSVTLRPDGEFSGADVKFAATVTGPQGTETTIWTARLTFNYTPLEIDQNTAKVTPMKFTVTGYEVQAFVQKEDS